jgi:hypothetical protein
MAKSPPYTSLQDTPMGRLWYAAKHSARAVASQFQKARAQLAIFDPVILVCSPDSILGARFIRAKLGQDFDLGSVPVSLVFPVRFSELVEGAAAAHRPALVAAFAGEGIKVAFLTNGTDMVPAVVAEATAEALVACVAPSMVRKPAKPRREKRREKRTTKPTKRRLTPASGAPAAAG